jgi:hypothetical protein
MLQHRDAEKTEFKNGVSGLLCLCVGHVPPIISRVREHYFVCVNWLFLTVNVCTTLLSMLMIR